MYAVNQDLREQKQNSSRSAQRTMCLSACAWQQCLQSRQLKQCCNQHCLRSANIVLLSICVCKRFLHWRSLGQVLKLRVVCYIIYCVPVHWELLQVARVPGTTGACIAAWSSLSKLWQVSLLDWKAFSSSSSGHDVHFHMLLDQACQLVFAKTTAWSVISMDGTQSMFICMWYMVLGTNWDLMGLDRVLFLQTSLGKALLSWDKQHLMKSPHAFVYRS